MLPTDIHGYRVVTLKFKETDDAGHCLYMKAHSVREKCPEKPTEKTLFVLGIPPYATEDSLARAFSIFAKVTAVHLHAKPSSSLPAKNTSKYFQDVPEIKGFKVAYIVFENSLGVSNALSYDSETPLVLSTKEAPVLVGLQKWCMEYNSDIADPVELQKEIDEYMADYDKRVAEEEERLKAASQPDEDGWVTVTKKGRRPGFARKESVGQKIMKKERQKRSKKQLLNFYRFQIRESKMNHLMSLREKFEEDKKKITVLKQSRKFKPY